MKNRLYALAALVTALALAACGGADRSAELTPEGIGPVRLGMRLCEVPAQAEGWYDAIAVEHTDESYDEMEDETIPAFDTYLFLLNGETMFLTRSREGDEAAIEYLEAVSPRIGYKGIRPGMTVADALAAGAECHAAGEFGGYADYFMAYLKVDDSSVYGSFDYLNGCGFTEEYGLKLTKRGVIDREILDVTGADFRPDAVVESLTIRR